MPHPTHPSIPLMAPRYYILYEISCVWCLMLQTISQGIWSNLRWNGKCSRNNFLLGGWRMWGGGAGYIWGGGWPATPQGRQLPIPRPAQRSRVNLDFTDILTYKLVPWEKLTNSHFQEKCCQQKWNVWPDTLWFLSSVSTLCVREEKCTELWQPLNSTSTWSSNIHHKIFFPPASLYFGSLNDQKYWRANVELFKCFGW